MSDIVQNDNLDEIEEIAKYIVLIQEDLENIALHLKELMDKMDNLERNQNKPQQSQISSNINFDYIDALVKSDTLERENKMKENITQNVLKQIPTQKNNQGIINAVIFTLLLVCLYLGIRG